jgi:membrane peptidoglycan carboxypeptidase
VIRDLLDTVSPENLAQVRLGLESVIAWGTGKELDVPGVAVAGKTGTAEFCDSYPSCLDRDGRVRTSHAWFTAYAPAQNPEIALVVFVYGGGEGSTVALPIAGEILRHYFGLESEQEADAASSSQDEPLPLETTFVPRLLGTDGWSGGGASVTGYVLDSSGVPLPGITINVLADEELISQVISGPTGQFDFNAIDPTRTNQWQIELADYPDSRPLTLDTETGYRYMMEFQAQDSGSGGEAGAG